MINDIPVEKMIRTARRFGVDVVEIFGERTRRTVLSFDDKRFERIAMTFDTGVGIRAFVDDRIAYGSTNDLSPRGLLNLSLAVGRALCEKKARTARVSMSERSAQTIATVRRHPYGIDLAKKCEIVQRADDIAWRTSSSIRQVGIVYTDVVRRIWVATSDGFFARDEQVGTLLKVHVTAARDTVLQTGIEQIGGAVGFELFDEKPPEEVAELAASRAVRMLSARPAPAGVMPVILAAEAGGTMIHEAVGHGLEADLANEQLSVYAGRLGEKVASDIVTVIDDATLPGGRGSFTFDDEGTPAQRTVLIERGILKSYLSNVKAAKKAGTRSTGNGRRQSYEHVPVVRMTNTFIQPGKDEPDAILRETPRGIYIKRMGGGQVNTVNGDFVFDVQEGYLVENGTIGEPVRGATLTGNGPKILTSIDRVGTDLGFSVGLCGKDSQEAPVSCGQPTIRIPEIVVGGTTSSS